jgi:large subunit ribosomal protein L11
MAKKVLTIIKLQIPGGQANPAPPVGTCARPARREHHGVLQGLQRADRARERPHHPRRDHGLRGPVVHVHHEDAPAAVLIKEALGLESGSGEPNRNKVGRLSEAQLRSIAEAKMPDLNARDVDEAMKVIAGTARSMGVETPV